MNNIGKDLVYKESVCDNKILRNVTGPLFQAGHLIYNY